MTKTEHRVRAHCDNMRRQIDIILRISNDLDDDQATVLTMYIEFLKADLDHFVTVEETIHELGGKSIYS